MRIKPSKNYSGVLLGKRPMDYILGKSITQEPLVSDWLFFLKEDYVLEHEHQWPYGFETAACTNFSGNDVKELLFTWALHNGLVPSQDKKWLKDNGYFKNNYINFDDRIPAMFSEIKEGVGTYQFIAAQALRRWSLPEKILPDKPKNFKEYIDQSKLTREALNMQIEFDKRFVWNWFWFDEAQDIKEQLKASPSMSVVKFANGEGCLKPVGQPNHAVMEYHVDENGCSLIDDSYEQQLKKYHKDYIKSRLGFRLTILNNNIMKANIQNNKLYLLVEGKEQQLAMGLDGKLVIFPDWSICDMNSRSRAREVSIPTTLTMEQWNTVDKINSKLEIIEKATL